MFTFKLRAIEDVKPPVEEKPTLKSFIMIVFVCAFMAALFLHLFSNHVLQKEEYNVRRLQKSIKQSKDKEKYSHVFSMMHTLSIKQMLLQKVLMCVTADFSGRIFWHHIFREKEKIFLVGETSAISDLTFFLKSSKVDFKLSDIKKRGENFEFQLYVD